MTTPALAETFIAAGAAVAVIRCFLLFFKGAHGLVVPPRHGSFLPVRTDSSGRATEKELSPRGYERNEIIHAWWVPPSKGKMALCEWKKHCPPALISHNIQFRLISVF